MVYSTVLGKILLQLAYFLPLGMYQIFSLPTTVGTVPAYLRDNREHTGIFKDCQNLSEQYVRPLCKDPDVLCVHSGEIGSV